LAKNKSFKSKVTRVTRQKEGSRSCRQNSRDT